MCGVVYLMNFLTINMYALLALQILVGALTYLLLVFIFKNDNLHYVMKTIKSLFKKERSNESD